MRYSSQLCCNTAQASTSWSTVNVWPQWWKVIVGGPREKIWDSVTLALFSDNNPTRTGYIIEFLYHQKYHINVFRHSRVSCPTQLPFVWQFTARSWNVPTWIIRCNIRSSKELNCDIEIEFYEKNYLICKTIHALNKDMKLLVALGEKRNLCFDYDRLHLINDLRHFSLLIEQKSIIVSKCLNKSLVHKKVLYTICPLLLKLCDILIRGCKGCIRSRLH